MEINTKGKKKRKISICTDYYLLVKYYSPLHVSSIKCLSSGGHSCIQAAYGTVTLLTGEGSSTRGI